MKKSLLVALSLAMLCTVAQAGRLEHGGSLFTKSAKAKGSGQVGCMYFTVTTAYDDKKVFGVQHPAFALSIQNQSTEIKYGESTLRFDAFDGFMSEIKLPDEYGETYEACLVPGEYKLDGIAFGDFQTTFSPRHFEPIAISLKAEDSLYLGNLYLEYPHEAAKPGLVIIRDRLERDRPYILKHSKHRLRDSMHASLLEPGLNSVVLREQP